MGREHFRWHEVEAELQREQRRRDRVAQRMRKRDGEPTADPALGNEAQRRSAEITARLVELNTILSSSLEQPPTLPFVEVANATPELPHFEPGDDLLPEPEPTLRGFAPTPPSWFSRRFLRGQERYDKALGVAQARQQQLRHDHGLREQRRKMRLAAARRAHEAKRQDTLAEIQARQADLAAFGAAYRRGDRRAVRRYVDLVLQRLQIPDGFPREWTVRHQAGHLKLEFTLPDLTVIPTVCAYQHVPEVNEIAGVERSEEEIHQQYVSVIAQVALRVLREIFVSDFADVIDAITFSGLVKPTGRTKRFRLVTVTVRRSDFAALTLRDIDAVACVSELVRRGAPDGEHRSFVDGVLAVRAPAVRSGRRPARAAFDRPRRQAQRRHRKPQRNEGEDPRGAV